MDKSKKIKVSELQEGDIILFESDDDLISTTIATLTKSIVSHTSLSCGKKGTVGTVIEEIPPKVTCSNILNRINRTAYVMRLESNINCEDVMKIAAKYAKEELPYAKIQLPVIAIYCIFNNFTTGEKLQGLFKRMINLSLGIVAELENEWRYDGKEAMMCSQFAYHCYREAGDKYKIKIKKESSENLINKIIDIISKNNIMLMKKDKFILDEQYEKDMNNQEQLLTELINEIDNNEKLYSDNELQKKDNKLNEDFVYAVCEFAKKMVTLFNREKDKSKDAKYYLEKLLDMSEYFISPGDLLSNTQNLKYVGVIDYENYHS